MSVEVRPFRRDDRDQLAALVNAHIAAVVPGGSVSVARLLSQLEREPGEFIVDPWVRDRVTLVAVQRGRVVAGAHLLRYGGGEDVGASYRETAEIRWFLFWPEAPYWPDSVEAADTLLAACLAQLDRWGAPRGHADGTLPHPGVYGFSEQWPHVRAAYARAGFAQEDVGRVETVYVARVDELPRPAAPPFAELVAVRTLGIYGTRLSATLNDEVVGDVEVEILDEGERQARADRLADVGNLRVAEPHRRRGIGRWLVAQAADWLQLARVDRVLAYARPEDDSHLGPFLGACGFRLLTRTERSWTRTPPGASGT
jgi:ribosomal protein S18 acetylase RimI-like enzyme